MNASVVDLGRYDNKSIVSIYDEGDGGLLIWNDLKFSYCGEDKITSYEEAIRIIQYQMDNDSWIFNHMNPNFKTSTK